MMTPSVFRLSVSLMEEPATLIVVITGNDRNLWYVPNRIASDLVGFRHRPLPENQSLRFVMICYMLILKFYWLSNAGKGTYSWRLTVIQT